MGRVNFFIFVYFVGIKKKQYLNLYASNFRYFDYLSWQTARFNTKHAYSIKFLFPGEKLMMDLSLKEFFSKGEEVLCTYVDDPRNTDNSWMETTAFSFHDESGDTLKYVALNAGDDAVGVKWTDLHREMALYATHRDFVEKVALVKYCHW